VAKSRTSTADADESSRSPISAIRAFSAATPSSTPIAGMISARTTRTRGFAERSRSISASRFSMVASRSISL
jgi:hypothetical protein